jgi:chemotaxis signal transduction protein
MTEERYMIFKKDNRLWGLDTMVLSGVVQEPLIEKIPFVPAVVTGLLFFKNEAVPVLNFTADDKPYDTLIIIESIYGKVGINVREILGIFNKEEIINERTCSPGADSRIIGRLNGEDVFYFDLKFINDFFKNIEIKN